MSTEISRRTVLKGGAVMGAGALIDLLRFPLKGIEGFSQTQFELEMQRLSNEYVARNPHLRAFEKVTDDTGLHFNIAHRPEKNEQVPLRLLASPNPSFIKSEQTGVFSYVLSTEESEHAVEMLGKEYQDLIDACFIPPHNPESPDRTILLIGDSFTLWRNWPLMLQQALSLTGHGNLHIKLSADFGTGPIEAAARLQYGNVIAREHYPPAVFHFISPGTDFVIDIKKARDNAPEKHEPVSFSQSFTSVLRSMYRDATVKMGGTPYASGSYIPKMLENKENEHAIQTWEKESRTIRTLANKRYWMFAFGDASLVLQKDFDQLDRIYSGLTEKTAAEIDPLYKQYPVQEYDQVDHPTERGCLFIAEYMYSVITGKAILVAQMETRQKLMHKLMSTK